ncbi:MAG: short-chain fatty acid transporter [Flavobacteriales bacterium]|nr:short-chain fatty acid transporter [Flavobacteriales bacterium]
MRLVQAVLPSPFVIAILLTFLTSVLALLLTEPLGSEPHIVQLFHNWESGVWDLLSFTMQMMLMLVLGHSLALSKPVQRLIRMLTAFATNNVRAAVMITTFSVLTGYFNWGLGLIFGAILCRKVGEYAQEQGIRLNYALMGACAYTALMVWHGGLSGSAPLTVAKDGHSLVAQTGVIPINETLFSSMNIRVFFCVLIALVGCAYLLARNSEFEMITLRSKKKRKEHHAEVLGAERLDRWEWFGRFFGLLILFVTVLRYRSLDAKYTILNLDMVNLILFGLALALHGSVARFIRSVEDAMRDATGILIQFPLYAGIMGMMTHSGLLDVFANYFITLSDPQSFPVFAFISSGLVNILVPSGGGQWQVQGPILVQAAQELHYPLSKTVMALAYGDQITNMLQPFWALPLLGITGLKAKHILPYSLLFMVLGAIIYVVALLYW